MNLDGRKIVVLATGSTSNFVLARTCSERWPSVQPVIIGSLALTCRRPPRVTRFGHNCSVWRRSRPCRPVTFERIRRRRRPPVTRNFEPTTNRGLCKLVPPAPYVATAPPRVFIATVPFESVAAPACDAVSPTMTAESSPIRTEELQASRADRRSSSAAELGPVTGLGDEAFQHGVPVVPSR